MLINKVMQYQFFLVNLFNHLIKYFFSISSLLNPKLDYLFVFPCKSFSFIYCLYFLFNCYFSILLCDPPELYCCVSLNLEFCLFLRLV